MSLKDRLADARRLDVAIYVAIARTPTPRLDGAMSRLSAAADYSRLSIASSVLLALGGGAAGRRAARDGLASIAVTSTVVNLGVKPLWRRRRPGREEHRVPLARHVPMPRSSSFPSGHSAAAFAFAAGVGHTLPGTGRALRALAALVAYSRIHTGVHYPADVVIGSLIGSTLGKLTTRQQSQREETP